MYVLNKVLDPLDPDYLPATKEPLVDYGAEAHTASTALTGKPKHRSDALSNEDRRRTTD